MLSQSGDVLLEINGAQCGLMTHKAGQEAIISCGDLVPLTVHRQDSQPPPAPLAWTPTVEAVGAAPVKAGVAGETYTKTSLAKAPVEEDHWDVRHNVTAKGFQPGGGAPGFRSVSAPVTRPGQENRGPPQLAQCWLCSQNIRGVFLQVKGNQGQAGGEAGQPHSDITLQVDQPASPASNVPPVAPS